MMHSLEQITSCSDFYLFKENLNEFYLETIGRIIIFISNPSLKDDYLKVLIFFNLIIRENEFE